MPFFFQALREERGRVQVARAGRMWLYLVLTAGLATCVFGPDLLRLLTPDAFTPAERYIPLVTLGMVFVAFLPVASVGLYMASATRWLAFANIGAAALNIGMNFALIPRIGAIGAAWSTFVAFGAQTILVLALAQRIYPLPFEGRRWAAACAAAAALGAAAFAIPDGAGAAGLAARGVVVLLFPAGLLLFGGVSREERAQIVSMVRTGSLGRGKPAPL
jgi:O-antigen/teichoic acid export membrane protein